MSVKKKTVIIIIVPPYITTYYKSAQKLGTLKAFGMNFELVKKNYNSFIESLTD
jgi:hypothetical protein